MKIAIVGKDSYIGNAIQNYLTKEYSYEVLQFDVLNNSYDSFDYSGIDVVIHVAAIVHRTDIDSYSTYQDVNVDLPLNVARLSKSQGVSQIIFFSSMAVYGKQKSISQFELNGSEPLLPYTMYGRSKLEAETALKQLQDDNFTVSIVRPPSVYGKGCKGNLFGIYLRLAKLLRFVPCSSLNVKQGVLHIDNLCMFVGNLIKEQACGIFHPQDRDLLSTSEMLYCIRSAIGKKVSFSKALGKIINLFKFLPVYTKLFGAVTYCPELSHSGISDDNFITTAEGIKRTFS